MGKLSDFIMTSRPSSHSDQRDQVPKTTSKRKQKRRSQVFGKQPAGHGHHHHVKDCILSQLGLQTTWLGAFRPLEHGGMRETAHSFFTS